MNIYKFSKLTWSVRVIMRSYCKFIKGCWSCDSKLNHNDMFCSNCNKIQKVNKEINYFELFTIKNAQQQIDNDLLTKKFRSLQSQIHPDKFSGKNENEQELSAEWSSLINKAYKVLQSPLNRGEYILKLHGIILPEQNTIDDPQFLMEMMEKNEQVEEAESKDELEDILVNNRNEMSQLSDDFALNIKKKNLEDAKFLVIKMKYLNSIERSIKAKLLKE